MRTGSHDDDKDGHDDCCGHNDDDDDNCGGHNTNDNCCTHDYPAPDDHITNVRNNDLRSRNYHIHCYRHDDKLACHVLYGDAIYSGNDDNAKHEAGSESIGNYGSRNDDSRSFNGRHDGFPDHPILHYKENIRVDYSDPEQTPRVDYKRPGRVANTRAEFNSEQESGGGR